MVRFPIGQAYLWRDGDELGFGGGARVVHVPGRTPGSIAQYLPRHGLLFTGDAVAGVGRVMLGVFNADREPALESMHRLSPLALPSSASGTATRSARTRRRCWAQQPPHRETTGHPTGTPASRLSTVPRSRARSAQRSRS